MGILKAITESIVRNSDFIVKTATIGAAVAAILTVILYLKADLRGQVTEMLRDPVLIERLAQKLKTPFLLFDSNGKVIYDGGGSRLIDVDNLEINTRNSVVKSIVINTTKLLNTPPIVSSVDRESYFREAKRLKGMKWEYEMITLDKLVMENPIQDKMPVSRYRIEIVQ